MVVCVRGTSAIIISDSLEQRDVVKLHPKEKHENNTRIIISNIFCAKGGLLLSMFSKSENFRLKMGGLLLNRGFLLSNRRYRCYKINFIFLAFFHSKIICYWEYSSENNGLQHM